MCLDGSSTVFTVLMKFWFEDNVSRLFSDYYFMMYFHMPVLTHWGWVMHICVIKLTIIGSDNGLSSGRWQLIIWTNAGITLIGKLVTNFSEIHIIHSIKKMCLSDYKFLFLAFFMHIPILLIKKALFMQCLFFNWFDVEDKYRFGKDLGHYHKY